MSLIELTPTELQIRFHQGQKKAWNSSKRFILVTAGLQSGKTEMGPPWLYREIQTKGPGDYLVVGPMFTLMEKKVVPAFRRFFEDILQLGKFVKDTFTFSEQGEIDTFGAKQDVPTKVFFGHAQRPGSLESATAKAAWLDEAGQDEFKLGSWDAIQGRLSINQGRVLMTTTPYNLGWLKQQVFDPWTKAQRQGQDHPSIDVVNFRSIDNPAFPREEYDRVALTMPTWKFAMRYDGLFSKPAGVIYDCWEPTDKHSQPKHVIPRREIPRHWKRYLGIDFGGVNTACIYFAEEQFEGVDDGVPTGRYIAYREYYPRHAKSISQHAADILEGEPRIELAYGGAGSEDQWRTEFTRAGLEIKEPKIASVDVGIEKCWGVIKADKIVAFDDLSYFLDEIGSYSYELDEAGEPVPHKIRDKETYHLLDSFRYLAPSIIGIKRELRVW